MRCVIRRALGVGTLALMLAAGVAPASTPAGPRLSVVKVTAKPYRSELLTVNPSGGHPFRLAAAGRTGPRLLLVFSSLSWSPDGEQGAFSGVVGVQRGDDHEFILRIFTVRADGSGLRVIRGTNGASGPVFSPNGHTVAFNRVVDRETPTTVGGKRRKYGFHGTSIWTMDLLTGAQRRLTPWRDGLVYIASSFSPDGSTLLATHEDSRLLNESEPVALEVDGSGSRRLLNDGSSPVYSPDGSRVALVRRTAEFGETPGGGSDLYVINADGTGVRRLTHTPGRYEFAPSWDPSGERLAYIRFTPSRTEAAALGADEALMQINADGTCQTKVFSAPDIYLSAPTWQPGPGRGAGRIEC
jgi:Tol biopolymer transport system component